MPPSIEHQINRLVWRPDVYGSIAFLVASYLADVAVTRRAWRWRPGGRPGWIAKLNLLGSVAFGLSAAAAFTLPTTGEVANIRLVNLGTFVGAVCFFVGAALLLPEVGRPTTTPKMPRNVRQARRSRHISGFRRGRRP